jgi:tetratricopeptide (TPR) repeat protein
MSWKEGGRKQTISAAQQVDVHISLARVAEQEGNVAAAEAGYRAALSRDKTRGDAHLHLANIHTLKGDYRQAAEEYQKALESNPGSADTFCDMGYSQYLQRKWEDAERNLKQAITINPNHNRAHNNLALVFAHTGRTKQALAEFRKAGASATDSHVNLAFSLSLDQRWQAAREEYRRALASNPNSELVRSRLRDIDRLIVANDRQAPSRGATRDTTIVPASTSRARAPQPPNRRDAAGSITDRDRQSYTQRATPAIRSVPASSRKAHAIEPPKPFSGRPLEGKPVIPPPRAFVAAPSDSNGSI